MLSEEEKERIDYQIKAEMEAKQKDLNGWIYAFFIAVTPFLLIALLIKGCS